MSALSQNAPYIAHNIVPREPITLPDTKIPDIQNLPRLEIYKTIAKNDPWIGDTPCGEEIFNAPKSLASLGPRQDGPLLTKPITAGDGKIIVNQPTFIYKSETGVTLKLVQPVVTYYSVSGRRYRDAQTYIFDERPLDSQRRGAADISSEDKPTHGQLRVATIAGILSPSLLSYTISGSRERYRLLVNQTELTAAFHVTLPRWKHYNVASARDKAKWDDLLCNAAHHELGHLRIRLDILAETLAGYADLPPAQSRAEMESLVINYRKDISKRVQDRQDAYHIYNEGGLRRGMTERPYAELPFPWLQDTEPKTAEQSPEQQ